MCILCQADPNYTASGNGAVAQSATGGSAGLRTRQVSHPTLCFLTRTYPTGTITRRSSAQQDEHR